MMDRVTTICYGQAKEWENRWDPIDVDLSAVTSLTSLGDFAFHDSKLDTVTLGATALGKINSGTFSGATINRLIIVGNGTDSAIPIAAFAEVDSLGTVEISGVKSIGNGAFYGGACQTVTLGSDLETIGQDAFSGCSNLSSLLLPPSVTSVGTGAFSNMGSGNSIVYYYGGNTYSNISSWGINSAKPYRLLTVADIITNGTITASGTSYERTVTVNENSALNATGNTQAIKGDVKNAIAGTGWTNTAGTEGKADIAIKNYGQSLSYKKVQFPKHAHSFTYSASGATITATCANTDGKCYLDDGQGNHTATLTINAWEAPSTPVDHKAKKDSAPQQSQKVETISSAPVSRRKLKAAAYVRVSTDLDSQETSIENQCDHYKSLIEANPAWELAGIYAESGVSGTKADTRPELQRLMQDCEAGAVDVIVTKSISRFARNTSECLSMARTLTSLGIRLIFEKENIDTETMESEFLLTLLAAFAE